MNKNTLLILLAAVILVLIAAIIILSRKRDLPKGQLIYDDLSHDGTPVQALTSSRYGLAGKPDMILRNGDQLIPVEVKHTPARERPFPGHMLQLAAYCLLIEEHYGIRPEYGIIRYRDRDFEVPYSGELEQKLLAHMEKMRAEDPKTMLPPVLNNSKKCDRCGFSGICSKLLEEESSSF